MEQLIYAISRETSKSGMNDFEFRVIGNDNMQNYYMELSRTKGINNIRFIGHVDDKHVVEELCRSDFLILPSIDKAEGFGRVALEAISAGIPVVVSIYAGISELIARYDAGITYDPLSERSERVFDIIREIHSDKEKYNRYINNGLKMLNSEGLTLKASVERTICIYNEV